MIRSRYSRWMNDWEYRLETRDSNRVVRPFEWGWEWLADFPGISRDERPASLTAEAQKRRFFELNRYLVKHSDEFFSYRTPADFRLEQRQIRVHGTGSSGRFCASPRPCARHIRRTTRSTRAGFPWRPRQANRAAP